MPERETLQLASGHCGCRIVGQGMEADGEYFCCAHCAGQRGAAQLQDRAEGHRLA